MLGKQHSMETRLKMRLVKLENPPSSPFFKKGGRTGSERPAWKGGISKLPYPFDFDRELKELVRKRDGYLCQLCGKNSENSYKKLAVHHVDYIKENCTPINLITLCNSCNTKVNFKRKIWTKFFQLKLKLYSTRKEIG